jgi:hypothetical protein
VQKFTTAVLRNHIARLILNLLLASHSENMALRLRIPAIVGPTFLRAIAFTRPVLLMERWLGWLITHDLLSSDSILRIFSAVFVFKPSNATYPQRRRRASP